MCDNKEYLEIKIIPIIQKNIYESTLSYDTIISSNDAIETIVDKTVSNQIITERELKILFNNDKLYNHSYDAINTIKFEKSEINRSLNNPNKSGLIHENKKSKKQMENENSLIVYKGDKDLTQNKVFIGKQTITCKTSCKCLII